MQIRLDCHLAFNYKSPTQKVRVITEDWVNREVFCPSCGDHLYKYPDNHPASDFFCKQCAENYELKSKSGNFGDRIVDGAYRTMAACLSTNNQPNFFLLRYDLRNFEVSDFVVIPKHFFVPEIIEQRTPLSSTARRAGWVGCNILLNKIPRSGKIYYVRNKKVESIESIMLRWVETSFLRVEKDTNARGWTVDIMYCIDKLNKREFSLSELYHFENDLRARHAKNRHIKDKIRQQLQFLRDQGYLDFLGKGRYRMRF